MEFKYIMLNDGRVDYPIIFPKNMVHILMMECMMRYEHNNPLTLVSAGFVNLDPIQAYGESESCKVLYPDAYKSRPQDTLIIMLYQWQHGVFNLESAEILLKALRRN